MCSPSQSNLSNGREEFDKLLDKFSTSVIIPKTPCFKSKGSFVWADNSTCRTCLRTP